MRRHLRAFSAWSLGAELTTGGGLSRALRDDHGLPTPGRWWDGTIGHCCGLGARRASLPGLGQQRGSGNGRVTSDLSLSTLSLSSNPPSSMVVRCHQGRWNTRCRPCGGQGPHRSHHFHFPQEGSWPYLCSQCSISVHPRLESCPKVILLLCREKTGCASWPPQAHQAGVPGPEHDFPTPPSPGKMWPSSMSSAELCPSHSCKQNQALR